MDQLLFYISLVRPHQWLKNLMLFFPPFLGGTLLLTGQWSKGVVPFIAFSLASSAGYIVNDLFDYTADQTHPHKSSRPLASGSVSRTAACWTAAALTGGGLLLALTVNVLLVVLISAYLMVSFLYSARLKHLPVVDLFCIAAGFVFRLQAGGLVFGIAVSEWLFLSVLLLSLFLSAGKRLSEKQTLRDNAAVHRRVLGQYPPGFLEGVLFMTGGAVLVTYTLYVIARHSQLLVYTVPLCCFGLLRYIFRVHSGKGGDPTESLIRDLPLFLVGLTWVVMVGWGIYGR